MPQIPRISRRMPRREPHRKGMIPRVDLLAKLLEFRALAKRLDLGEDALREIRERKLRSLVHHAWSRVPYYRSLFDAAGVDPASIRTLDDLARIPITTKDDLRAAGLGRILARGTDRAACFRFWTSGTTGKPFEVFLSRSEERTQLLIRLRALWAAGLFRPRERIVFLGPVRWRPLHLYQRLGLFRRDYISPRLPVGEQVARLRRLDPSILLVYPSVLAALLESLDGRLSAAVRPRAIVTNAEVMPDSLRAVVDADLEVEWFNFYGTVEAGRLAWECRTHAGLHLSADTCVLETIGRPGESGRAVVTVLDGHTMPFIRYDLGDICEYLARPCPCGIVFPLLGAPAGRISGLVRLPDGRSISAWVLESILRCYPEISEYRMRQDSFERLVVLLVPRGPLPDEIRTDLQARLVRILGEALRVDIAVVNHLPTAPLDGVFVSTV
jgi:phenylacetate-CoA ligase